VFRALGTVAALAALAGCGDDGGGGDAAGSRGEQLFVERCGSCHTLREAGTSGSSLDLDEDLRSVDEARVLRSITDPPTGMPKDLAQGADAEAIAEYVARNRTSRRP
jgi:mono/diheme cytochrome c family protein